MEALYGFAAGGRHTDISVAQQSGIGDAGIDGFRVVRRSLFAVIL